MNREILFSDEAIDMLISVSSFIEDKWSKSTADKFLKLAYKTFETVSNQPYIYKSSSFGEKIRIGLINKNCSFYYEIKEASIVILFLWDNRQEPTS